MSSITQISLVSLMVFLLMAAESCVLMLGECNPEDNQFFKETSNVCLAAAVIIAIVIF